MFAVRIVIDGQYLYLILQDQFTGHQILHRPPYGLPAYHKRHPARSRPLQLVYTTAVALARTIIGTASRPLFFRLPARKRECVHVLRISFPLFVFLSFPFRPPAPPFVSEAAWSAVSLGLPCFT